MLILAPAGFADGPQAIEKCNDWMAQHGAPPVHYRFVGYLPVVNYGEIKAMRKDQIYYVEQRYFQSPTTDLTCDPKKRYSLQDEQLPFLRFLPFDDVDQELRRDNQLVIESFRTRRKFSPQRLDWIMKLEKVLPRDRMIFFKMYTPDQLTEEFLRIFDGTEGVDTPLERHTNFRAPEREVKRYCIFELGRAYKWGLDDTSYDDQTFAPLLSEIATYLDQHCFRRGLEAVIYIHTDTLGAKQFFPKYGFQIVRDPDGLGQKDEYVLRAEGRDFVAQHRSRGPIWKYLWSQPMRRHLAFEMYDAPFIDGSMWTEEGRRPVIAQFPRYDPRTDWEYSHNDNVYDPNVDPFVRILAAIRGNRFIQGLMRRPPHEWNQLLFRSPDLAF